LQISLMVEKIGITLLLILVLLNFLGD